MLVWLSVWDKVQICIWPSWCHCHSPSLAPVNPDWFYLSGTGSPSCPRQRAIKRVLLLLFSHTFTTTKGHAYKLQATVWENSLKRGLRSSPDLDPDLGWPWKSYRRECLIDLNKYHYLVCGCIVFHCWRTDGRTFLLGFFRSSLRRWPKKVFVLKVSQVSLQLNVSGKVTELPGE